VADSLTGLDDRRAFLEALANARQATFVAVVLVDVDALDEVNRAGGHQAGDRALKAVAAALSGCLRRGDELFRIGGDEFAAILSINEADEAFVAGQRLREAVARAGLIGVSVGVALPESAETDDEVLARAAQALVADRL
jgi:diguanylate cyclase (GGDEF)-like protein